MELMSKIEAILFLYGEELEVERLEKFFEVSRDEMVEALGKLKALKENTGINLKTKDGKVSLVTNPLYGEVLFNFFNPIFTNIKHSISNIKICTKICNFYQHDIFLKFLLQRDKYVKCYKKIE